MANAFDLSLLLREWPEAKTGEDFQKIKEAALTSILEVIQDEIFKTQLGEDSLKRQHKLEALKAIEQVLMKECHATTAHQPSQPPTETPEDNTVTRLRTRTTHKVTMLRKIQGRSL